jgi:hypothetical protein
MTVQTIRSRSLAPSRRARSPRLGGAAEPRHLDVVLLASLAVSTVLALAIVVARGLAALG